MPETSGKCFMIMATLPYVQSTLARESPSEQMEQSQ